MELPLLSSRITAYRQEIGVSALRFAELIGVNVKTLRRLENGEKIFTSTQEPFIAALEKRQFTKDNIPEKERKPDRRFAHVTLPVSLKDEQEALTNLTARYLVRIRSWSKSNPRKGAAEPIELMAYQLMQQQEASRNRPPFQRQCLLIGMIQGMMLKEGIMTAKEALEDHNTLYYVP